MVFNQKLIVSTINAAKSTEDSYTSSEHSADGDSAPWSACSSTDMCTPMPHMTSHPINFKRHSNASDCSLTSATQTSAASSDLDAMEDPVHTFAQPATRTHTSSVVINSEASHDYRMFADAQNWSSGEVRAPTAVKSSNPNGSSDHPSSYNAFSNWRPEPISRASYHGYYSAKAAPVYGVGEHTRSASHHSTTSSVDSWNSHSHDDRSDFFCPSSTVASLSQMSPNSLYSRSLTGANLPPAAHAASYKPSNLMATQASFEALNMNKSTNDARSLLDSLTPLPPAYSSSQTGVGASSLMDPQTLMAYNAAFGASPLLYLYGFTPELLAARSAALAQLVNTNASAKLSGTSTASVVDDGSNPGSKKTNLYKTELCRSWEEKGTCRYGSKCQFAHGQDELKNVSRHPKFKTEICRTFWLHGSCPYGKRCCFLHTTSTEAGASSAGDARDNKQGTKSARNAHDPPTSRLQKRVSASPLSVTSPDENSLGIPSSSPQLHSAPPTRSLSDFSHSRSNSNSSCSQSSDGSSHIDSLRIQIWPRFGAREQVPPQDAPGPRSRLQRLRPTEDYTDSSNSLPSTSTLSTTRYSPFLDRHQPPHSAFSDISSILARSPSQQISKAHSVNGAAEAPWPLSRLPSSANIKA